MKCINMKLVNSKSSPLIFFYFCFKKTKLKELFYFDLANYCSIWQLATNFILVKKIINLEIICLETKEPFSTGKWKGSEVRMSKKKWPHLNTKLMHQFYNFCFSFFFFAFEAIALTHLVKNNDAFQTSLHGKIWHL